ncbi:MAG: hypothetical protein AMXMBFR84_02920 [Candidatus Hydrogenedentota bacterium]
MMGALTSKGYWLALIGAVSLAFGYAYHRDLWTQYDDLSDSENQVRVLEQEVEARTQLEEDMKERVESLGQDPVEIEAKVRSEGQVKEGEKIFRIQLPTDLPSNRGQ